MDDQRTTTNIVPLPVDAFPPRRLSLHRVTVDEGREELIKFLTAHWEQSLITLAQRLRLQGFREAEILELCEEYRPMFNASMRSAIRQYDENAAKFDEKYRRAARNG